MTQVPPTRYSSAIITCAPWLAATRAARTPPDPAPITNRSTSRSAIVCSSTGPPAWNAPVRRSQIVTSFLEFNAHLGNHLFGQLVGPVLGEFHAAIDNPRLLRKHLLADRRGIECE